MRTTPTFFKRITLASAAAITTLALSTGCTISLDGLTGTDEATPAPDTQQQPAEEPRNDPEPPNGPAPEDDTPPGPHNEPGPGFESTGPTTNAGAGAAGQPPAGSSAPVPPGTSLKALHEHEISGTLGDTGYANVHGVFTAEADAPVMIRFDVEILDSSGNLITSGEGLNQLYTTGRSTLVTRNLVKVDEQDRAKVHSFRMRISDITEMRDAPHLAVSEPTPSQSGSTPSLTGTWEVKSPATRKMSAISVTAACVGSDGQVYVGEQSIDPDSADSGTYNVPMYDLGRDNRNMSSMTCYASA